MSATTGIGDRTKYFMDIKGFSQADLAKKARLSASTISEIINGVSVPEIPTLENICDALEIDLCEFFRYAAKTPPDYMVASNSSELILIVSDMSRSQYEEVLHYAAYLKQKGK